MARGKTKRSWELFAAAQGAPNPGWIVPEFHWKHLLEIQLGFSSPALIFQAPKWLKIFSYKLCQMKINYKYHLKQLWDPWDVPSWKGRIIKLQLWTTPKNPTPNS